MKIGILTFYYNNFNYGGQLQAYAMSILLNNMGFDAEQIPYESSGKSTLIMKILNPMRPTIVRKIKGLIKRLKEKHTLQIDSFVSENIKIRENAIKQFELDVPHNKKVYNNNNISECNDIYDAFVVGSDQVWNIDWFKDVYYLNFADKNKLKISYAASMPKTNLLYKQKKHLKYLLSGFYSISVREDNSKRFLSTLLNKDIKHVLDPTLMLDNKEWDHICSKRLLDEKYVFCYFLTNGMEKRNLAREYAKKNNLKIVTLPYMSYKNTDDENFGDYRLYDIRPNDFISLIKNAEFIFTDSFHAIVFCNIYEKEFCVADRNVKNQEYMLSRIYSLLNLFGENDRMLNNTYSIKDIENMKPINYYEVKNIINREKEKSKKFLSDSLAER